MALRTPATNLIMPPIVIEHVPGVPGSRWVEDVTLRTVPWEKLQVEVVKRRPVLLRQQSGDVADFGLADVNRQL